MPRSPRRPSRGRRESIPEVEPIEVAEPIEELEPIPSRGGRGRRAPASRGGGGAGMGIGAKILTITIPPFAVIALVFGLLILKNAETAPPPGNSMDAGGIAAARLLAAPEPDSWSPQAFMRSAVRAQVQKVKEDELERDHPRRADSRNAELQKSELETWKADFLDKYVPEDEMERDKLALWVKRFEKVQTSAGAGFLGAKLSVKTSQGSVNEEIWSDNSLRGASISAVSGRQEGDTVVAMGTLQGIPARGYQQPIVNLKGATVGTAQVFLREPVRQASTGGTVRTLTILLIVLVIGAGVVVSLILTTLISTPLRHLVRDIDAVARGDTERRFQVREGGEIGLIARHLEKMTQNLETMKHAEVEQQTAEAQLSIAAQIQENLLPEETPRIEGYEVEALHKPSPDLGTDYHDFLEIDEKHLGVIVADASMKGTTGAMIMSQIRSLIRAFAPETLSPAEVLRDVNQVFAKDLRKGLYVTASYMILNRETGVVSVANAGHAPTLFWKLSKRAIARLPSDGLALGLDAGPVFDQKIADKRVQLEAGDRVLLYTDGAIEAQNARGELYGEDSFFEIVKRESPKNSAAFVNLVANEIDLFHEGAVQRDDITLVTIRKVR